jgi:hypothetical protein
MLAKATPPFRSVCMRQLGDWRTKEHETDQTQDLISVFSWDYHPNQQTLEVWGQRTGSP